jgi:hypothetical protein
VVSLACCVFVVWAYRTGVPEPMLFAGFCLAFGAWLQLVRKVRHVIGLLPAWFQRGDVTAGH